MSEWRRDARGLGDAGVTAMLAAVQARLGGPPLAGTRFLFDGHEMLATARRIERSLRGRPATLFVGFQRAEQAERERDRYERLVSSGVSVVAFGVGEPSPAVRGIRWVAVPFDPDELLNQWFLVTRGPEPAVLVGFETSPGERFGRGPAGAAGRSWAAFVSDDPRLVDALVRWLGSIAGTGDDQGSGPSA